MKPDSSSLPAGPPASKDICVADVPQEPIHWLWYPYFPLGKISLIDGDPNVGKSLLTLDLAARVTTGAPMPDGSPGVHGSVLLISAEDDIADTVRPRFVAAGGDLTRLRALR